jgi:hypothetical protein
MDDLFGVPMRVGAISPLEKGTTAVLAQPVEGARACVEEQAVAHVDETNWVVYDFFREIDSTQNRSLVTP